MDRDFADAIISFAQWRDPERVSEVIANVDRELRAKGYSAEEIAAAVDELLDELNGKGQPRHPITCHIQTITYCSECL